jgi:hypothetical protein
LCAARTKAPAQLATELVDGTKLADAEVRRSLIDADETTIAASEDTTIAFARLIDPDLLAIRRAYEDQIQSELIRNSERIANATFRLDGTSTYPDATFTLRVSFGTVKG